jgi:hypothetical protein
VGEVYGWGGDELVGDEQDSRGSKTRHEMVTFVFRVIKKFQSCYDSMLVRCTGQSSRLRLCTFRKQRIVPINQT